ncbi:MAG: DNA-binding protein [Gemmatimonadetes bacterium]|nr:DNA-binding protein [Gemmatimonadota bacterium]
MTDGGEPVVVDTNILFSALLRADTVFAQVLFHAPRTFFICETTLAELFRRKDKLMRRTRMDEAALVRSYHLLLKRVEVSKEDRIPAQFWSRARTLCAGLDADDEPQIALTLALHGLLWTGDKVLKTGLIARGFDRFFIP